LGAELKNNPVVAPPSSFKTPLYVAFGLEWPRDFWVFFSRHTIGKIVVSFFRYRRFPPLFTFHVWRPLANSSPLKVSLRFIMFFFCFFITELGFGLPVFLLLFSSVFGNFDIFFWLFTGFSSLFPQSKFERVWSCFFVRVSPFFLPPAEPFLDLVWCLRLYWTVKTLMLLFLWAIYPLFLSKLLIHGFGDYGPPFGQPVVRMCHSFDPFEPPCLVEWVGRLWWMWTWSVGLTLEVPTEPFVPLSRFQQARPVYRSLSVASVECATFCAIESIRLSLSFSLFQTGHPFLFFFPLEASVRFCRSFSTRHESR